MTDFSLLRTLCSIHAPSGNEAAMTSFLLNYIEEHQSAWKAKPVIHSGNGFQDCIVLVFGSPRTAVYSHMDNIGYTVRYGRELVPIGAPHAESGTPLWGDDGGTNYECQLVVDEEELSYRSQDALVRGMTLSYQPNWREDNEFVQCCYMDNRLGVWVALELCKTLENGAVVFSCWEEHGGGSIAFLSRFLYEQYNIIQSLICDITWVTEGVKAGGGVAISLRDSRIPRHSWLKRIVSLAKESGIPFQLEVERTGGSDGTEIQKQPWPIDWCFIGAPEQNVHTPVEKVHKEDIRTMVEMYRYLMSRL